MIIQNRKSKRQVGQSLLASFFVAFFMLATQTFLVPFQDAAARPLDEVIKTKYLRVFVYEDFIPFSYMGDDKKMTGIDVEIAQMLADKLGVSLRLLVRQSGETVDDDLRNNVWKGHYIGGGVADVMLHVPVDDVLRKRNDMTVIFGRYYTERMALLSDPEKVGTSETLAPFLGAKIGVELDTLADFYLSSPQTLGGRIRNNVVRYKEFKKTIAGINAGEVSGLMGPRSQLEAAIFGSDKKYLISSPPFPGMSIPRWNIGMAVKTDSRDLGYSLGDVILELQNSGELEKIFSKYGLSYFKDFLD